MLFNSASLAQWIENYVKKQNYVAHAIWENNVNLALTDGYLRSAEDIFRRTNVVSCESGYGYGMRGQIEISQTIVDQLEQKATLPKKVVVDLHGKLTLMDAIKWDLISEATLIPLLNKQSKSAQIVINNKLCEFSAKTKVFDSEISPFVSFENYTLGEYYDETKITYQAQLEKLYEKYNRDLESPALSEHTIQVILDRNRARAGESIDQRLSFIWDTYTKASLNKDYQTLADQLAQARRGEIFIHKMHETIRTLYNKIAWGYGDVAVIRGNPNEVISWMSRYKKAKGTEISLLYPFENEGNCFSLDLSTPDVILLGPKTTLAPYEGRNFQLCYFEEMSEEHLNFFEVPNRLRLFARATADNHSCTLAAEPTHEIKQEVTYTAFSHDSTSKLGYFKPKEEKIEPSTNFVPLCDYQTIPKQLLRR